MRINDLVIFIDSKGVSHNALVKSFREHRDATNKLVHDEPLVTLTYHVPPAGEPRELIDVPHISHPLRQESNPDLPSYPLHAWKYEDEDHRELPPDHPVHDHINEQPKFDDQGNVIPKRRPHYERHIAEHRARGTQELGTARNVLNVNWNQVREQDGVEAVVTQEAASPVLPLGHPDHPETVAFDFTCDGCGEPVKRIASHQGGKQWDGIAGATCTPPTTGVIWKEHVCKPEDVAAYREKLAEASKPKEPELSPSERLAQDQQLTPPPNEKEPGVIAQREQDANTEPPAETAGDQA